MVWSRRYIFFSKAHDLDGIDDVRFRGECRFVEDLWAAIMLFDENDTLCRRLMFFWHFGCLPKTCLEKTHAEVVELDYGKFQQIWPIKLASNGAIFRHLWMVVTYFQLLKMHDKDGEYPNEYPNFCGIWTHHLLAPVDVCKQVVRFCRTSGATHFFTQLPSRSLTVRPWKVTFPTGK